MSHAERSQRMRRDLAPDAESPYGSRDEAAREDRALREDDEWLLGETEKWSPAEAPEGLPAPESALSSAATVRLTSPARPPRSTPRSVGGYEILRELGRGGMGVVYLAQQERPVRRQVALKLVAGGRESRRVLARFALERQVLAHLDHPHVAHVFDAGTNGEDQPYFVMEHVDGLPIDRYCDTRRLDTRRRLQLIMAACSGVEHAHQKGIIHRDIKPANILVTEIDGVATPKIIDFGVAKAIDTAVTGVDLAHPAPVMTSPGQAVGTPLYMSPEQMAGAHDIDTRTDVYALGVVLYELLTGTAPLAHGAPGDESPEDLRRRMRELDPTKPSTRVSGSDPSARRLAELRSTDCVRLRRELQGDLDWICLRALERDRSRRYGSAQELAADLRRHLSFEPVHAGPPSTFYLFKRFVRRNRTTVAASAGIVLSLAVGLGWALSERDVARRAWQVASEEKGEAQRAQRRAEREGQRADAALHRVLRLSDLRLLAELRRDAEALWPARPDRIADMEAWLHRAKALVARLPDHRRARAELLLRGRVASAATSAKRPPHEHDDSVEPIAQGAGARSPSRPTANAIAWQLALSEELIAGLEALDDSGRAHPREDTLAALEARIELSRAVGRESTESDGARAAWLRACASIADAEACPAYRGLRLEPIPGLLPLGRDPDSGLWEFWHVASGARPVRETDRTAANRWRIAEDTGVVLVLVPGGRARMGAAPPAPVGLAARSAAGGVEVLEVEPEGLGARLGIEPGDLLRSFAGLAVREPGELSGRGAELRDGATVTAVVDRKGATVELVASVAGGRGAPYVDPMAMPDEAPVREVALDPFFISKYELTQGQWRRVEQDPSLYTPASAEGAERFDLRHPVENVTWFDCRRALGRLGLEFPTEAQWERAARAGSSSVFGTGDEHHAILRFANTAEQFRIDRVPADFLATVGKMTTRTRRWVRDSYIHHAPVGSFIPNAFGLHDVLGNVWEWCADAYAPYSAAVEEGSGLRTGGDPSYRISRGGGFANVAAHARIADRPLDSPGHRSSFLGVRPALRLARPARR